MNIIIVDDNEQDRIKLEQYVNQNFCESLMTIAIRSYSSAESFLKAENSKSVDVIFLDIMMENIDGIQLAKKIREENESCIIVFVSNSNDYAVESYAVSATQYLLKPYTYEQFEKVMNVVNNKIKKTSSYFDLRVKSETKRVLLSKIIYVDYCNHYVQVHVTDELLKSYVVTFADIEATLTKFKNFIWCYRSVLVNLDKVEKIENNCFKLTNGESLPINREKLKQIKETYREYLFSIIAEE
ncbi:MAG: LytTR family DNA-binding domain-containing protein [Clostridia bacterium]